MNRNLRILTTRVAVLIGFAIALSYASATDSVPVAPKPAAPPAPASTTLSSFSTKAEIETRLTEVKTESERLMKEEASLKKEIRAIDLKMLEYISSTNAINDPDIIDLKKKLDDAERLVKTLRGALQEQLYNRPEYKQQSAMKIAAFSRITTIREHLRGLMGEKAILTGRLSALEGQQGGAGSTQDAGKSKDKPAP